MEKQITSYGKNISFYIAGEGDTVVLLHGFAEDASVWQHQIDFLKDRYQLIVPDLPGSGKSKLPGDVTLEIVADMVKDILDSVFPGSPENNEGSRYTMIGHSMGGYITLAFAEKYPQCLNGFGLFHSSAFPDSEEKKITRKKGIDFINQQNAFDFLKSSLPNLFSPATREQNPELIADQVNKSAGFTGETLISYYKAMMERPDRTDVLIKSAVPVLFIIGEDDAAVPLPDSLKQCHLPERSHIHVLKNCGHMGMLEATESTNRYLSRFLSDVQT